MYLQKLKRPIIYRTKEVLKNILSFQFVTRISVLALCKWYGYFQSIPANSVVSRPVCNTNKFRIPNYRLTSHVPTWLDNFSQTCCSWGCQNCNLHAQSLLTVPPNNGAVFFLDLRQKIWPIWAPNLFQIKDFNCKVVDLIVSYNFHVKLFYIHMYLYEQIMDFLKELQFRYKCEILSMQIQSRNWHGN
jgi:hypothetical protein